MPSSAASEEPGAASAAFTRVVRAAPLLAFLVFAAVLAPYHDLVPFWDSRQYAETVLDATAHGFDLLRLNCLGHPTALYMALVAAGQKLAPGSTVALLVVNVLLGGLALFSFHRIALRLIPSGERGTSLLPGLATVAFALHPVFLAGAVFLCPDYGVAVFVLAAAAALLEERIGWAVAAGTFAVWSKQQGVVVYTILVFFFVLCRFLASREPWRRTLASSRRLLWLLLPIASFTVYPLLKLHGLIVLPFFDRTGPGLLASSLTLGSRRVLLGYLVLIFVLNGAWLATAIALAGGARGLARARARGLAALRERLAASELFQDRSVVILTFVVATIVLTRFQTFLNPRYFLPLYPLLLLSTVVGLRTLSPRRSVQTLAMGSVCLLLGLSVWRTTDPVSRAIFGTFDFGEHQMLRMTSLTGEGAGYGRDQLVYSLEVARFARVMDEMLPALTAAPPAPFVVYPEVGWHYFGTLDRTTGKRTLAREGTVRFQAISSADVLSGKLQLPKLVLLEFPNFARESPLPRLLRTYDLAKVLAFDSSGYRAHALLLVRRKE